MVKKARPASLPTEAKRRVGRPSTFSQDVADEICRRMIEGENLTKICSDASMPSRYTVYSWFEHQPDFRTRCAHAREGLADFLLDKIEAMADEATKDNVDVMKLKISTAQWRAQKMAPRVYGNNVITEITGNVSVQSQVIDVRQLDQNSREAFKQALLSASKIIEHDPTEMDDDDDDASA